MPDTSQTRTIPPESSSPRWISPLLFVVAAVVGFLSMILTTGLRYGFQGLQQDSLFDLTRTANVIGLGLEAPFIIVFLVLAARARRRAGLATAMMMLSGVGLVTLTFIAVSSLQPVSKAMTLPAGMQYVLTGYLILKAVTAAILLVTLRNKGGSGWRVGLRIMGLAYSLVAVVFAGVIVTVLLSPIGSAIVSEPHAQFDAAVVLGAAVWSNNRPSPVLRERVRRGYDLLNSGAVQFIVVTGGSAPGELPEAEVARRELISLGADPTRIVTETRTNSTEQQIFFIRDQLFKQGWKSFVIVSDQFHLKRALEICAFNGISAVGVSSESPLGPQTLAFYNLRESAALILYWVFGI